MSPAIPREVTDHMAATEEVLQEIKRRLGGVEAGIADLQESSKEFVTRDELRRQLGDHMNTCPAVTGLSNLRDSLDNRRSTFMPSTFQGWLSVIMTIVTLVSVIVGATMWFSEQKSQAAEQAQLLREVKVLVEQSQRVEDSLHP